MDSVIVILHAMSLSWEGWRGEEGAWGTELPWLRSCETLHRGSVTMCAPVAGSGRLGYVGGWGFRWCWWGR